MQKLSSQASGEIYSAGQLAALQWTLFQTSLGSLDKSAKLKPFGQNKIGDCKNDDVLATYSSAQLIGTEIGLGLGVESVPNQQLGITSKARNASLLIITTCSFWLRRPPQLSTTIFQDILLSPYSCIRCRDSCLILAAMASRLLPSPQSSKKLCRNLLMGSACKALLKMEFAFHTAELLHCILTLKILRHIYSKGSAKVYVIDRA